MKRLSLFALAALLFSCSDAPENGNNTDSPAVDSVAQYTIDQFLSNANIYSRAFSFDESELLVGSNVTGIYNANMINLESGEIRPITESTDRSVWANTLFPNDNRMLFSADNDGDEIDHIFLLNEDGTEQDLTPVEGARAGYYGWTDDLTAFYYGFNSRDNRFMDVYKMDVESMESTLLYQNDEGYDFNEISNDERYIALTKTVNSNDNDLFLYDRESEERIQINANQSSNRPAEFSVDNKYLYYLTDDGSEFMHLMKYDLATGEITLEMEDDWGISYAYSSKTGKYRVVGINQDGRTAVKQESSLNSLNCQLET
jgi:Tol biopolymer transport system component